MYGGWCDARRGWLQLHRHRGSLEFLATPDVNNALGETLEDFAGPSLGQKQDSGGLLTPRAP